jgi:hypothetical protein
VVWREHPFVVYREKGGKEKPERFVQFNWAISGLYTYHDAIHKVFIIAFLRHKRLFSTMDAKWMPSPAIPRGISSSYELLDPSRCGFERFGSELTAW